MNKPFKCLLCIKGYLHLKNLRVHVKQAHPSELNEIAPLPERKYSCSFCFKQYNSKQFLSLHERKTHGAFYVKSSKTYACPLCDFDDIFKKKLIEHFLQSHNISLETEEHTFSSRDEFDTWKEAVERETDSKFVQKSGFKTKRLTQIAYYECHRSGTFKSKSSGVRRLKSQGSKKIGGLCPATMAVTMTSSKIKVRFTKTHIGHTNELGHISLTSSEEVMIAEKIALDVPFDSILDEVRECVTTKRGLSKLHMLTRHDLHNIKHRYNLYSNVVQENNGDVTIDDWVLELERHNSCVLLYKPVKSKIKALPALRLDDFVLVIMSDVQKKMLQLHGYNVCIDRSHTWNRKNLEVVTLLVLDELNQGFPCSFLVSNRCDEEILKIFFELIKDNFGYLSPNIFMSDVEELFYKAFITVMNVPKKRLFCSWHVDNAWRKSLNMISMKEKRIEVYQMLRKLLHETNVNVFESLMYENVNKMLLDPDTMEFGGHFNEKFSANAKLWAACHTIIEVGFYTNMHLESLHKTVRNICFQGKQMNKLDVMLSKLMDFIQARLDNGLAFSYEEKVAEKVRNIAESHEISLITNDILINNDSSGWRVCSNIDSDIYFIQESNENCNCQMMCMKCNICIHKYCCSCSYSSLKLNMCVHIHLLCQLQLQQTPTLRSEDSTVTGNINDNNITQLNDLILSTAQEVQNTQAHDANNSKTIYVLKLQSMDKISTSPITTINDDEKPMSHCTLPSEMPRSECETSCSTPINENMVVDNQSMSLISPCRSTSHNVEQTKTIEDSNSLPLKIQKLNNQYVNLLKTISSRAGLSTARHCLDSLKTNLDKLASSEF